MKLEKIISMANQTVRLRFLAMERSLRATGCQLPLWVIPYDDNRFDLPEGAMWWDVPSVSQWLTAENAHPVMKKYQCLTTANYQFVDSDICFLRNPEDVLANHTGFITSCGHWRCAEHTVTTASQQLMAAKTTHWQRNVFNTGQFACDRALFSSADLQAAAMAPDAIETCVRWPFHEQPGLNLLVFKSGVEINNLTLPPTCMESTWAGDYPGDPQPYWTDPQRQPYLIHWAGTPMDRDRPIHQIFYDHLTPAEKAEWDRQVQNRVRSQAQRNAAQSMRQVAQRWKQAFHTLVGAS